MPHAIPLRNETIILSHFQENGNEDRKKEEKRSEKGKEEKGTVVKQD